MLLFHYLVYNSDHSELILHSKKLSHKEQMYQDGIMYFWLINLNENNYIDDRSTILADLDLLLLLHLPGNAEPLQ